MTTVHQLFTIRSFRSSKDRDFLKALEIYDANTHPQVKTDSREIAHWLDKGSAHPGGTFYVCGLYVSGELVGYTEFIHLTLERVIHIDYFVIQSGRRSAGAFHTLAEQMRSFFVQERLQWDFITAEVASLDATNGGSRYAQRLVRLFRQIGFSEALVEYEQPLLGITHPDTTAKATFLVLPRVEMQTISASRFVEIVTAIYRKHYGVWYSIYTDTSNAYQQHLDDLLNTFKKKVSDQTVIRLRGPEREFPEAPIQKSPPFREALYYILKITFSAIAAASFNILLRSKSEISALWTVGIACCCFVLLAVTISLTEKKQFEAFKLVVSLVTKLFDR